MNKGDFWMAVTAATVVSIAAATVVAWMTHWVYGLIVYFCIDFVLDGLLIAWATRQDKTN